MIIFTLIFLSLSYSLIYSIILYADELPEYKVAEQSDLAMKPSVDTHSVTSSSCVGVSFLWFFGFLPASKKASRWVHEQSLTQFYSLNIKLNIRNIALIMNVDFDWYSFCETSH